MNKRQRSSLPATELNVPTLPSELILPPPFVVPFPAQYFTLPTTMAAVGPRGRGKTYNLMLWNKWMFDNEYFTRCYMITPTLESNDAVKVVPLRPGDVYDDINESVAALQNILYEVEKDAAWYTTLTETYPPYYERYLEADRDVSRMDRQDVAYLRLMQPQILAFYENYAQMDMVMEVKSKAIEYTLKYRPEEPDKRIESILGSRFDYTHPWFYPPPKIKRPTPLLFIDDCSHSPIYAPSRNNPLVNATLRHRHIGGKGFGISIQFAVQTFKSGVPKALRNNVMQFLVFKTHDIGTIEDIFKEVGAFCTEEEFMELYSLAIKDGHDFLLIDLNAKDETRVFRRGFDTFLILHSSLKKKWENEEKEEN